MELNNLTPAKGSVKTAKRIGRGAGSGLGGTSTRGHKGAKSRSGYSKKIGFEGGQMPMQRRLPKFGFKNINRVEYKAINLSTLQALAEAKKLENMTAQERAEHERDALKKELDELKKADALNKMAQEARKMLSNEKINVSDGLVNMMVTSEAKTTKENVDNFIKMFKAAVQDAVKDSLRGKAPTTGGSSTLTRAELDKKLAEIASPAERQRLIAQHIDLFTKGK